MKLSYGYICRKTSPKKAAFDRSPAEVVHPLQNQVHAQAYKSDRLFQHRAQVLLRDIQRLELRKSTWQDAERIRTKYAKRVTTNTDCSTTRCDYTVTLDHWCNFLRSSTNLQLVRALLTALRLSGGRWAPARHRAWF
jgi:hypothetical protein